MTITMEEEIEAGFDFDCRGIADEAISCALSHEGFPYEAEISLTLTDNESIREINREYRKIDAPTDVLSFPMLTFSQAGDFSGLEDWDKESFNPDTGEALLGDIVISVEKVKEQAEAYGHSEKREFAFLIVHSVLHLLGYDHMVPKDAAFMENKQEDILKELDILR